MDSIRPAAPRGHPGLARTLPKRPLGFNVGAFLAALALAATLAGCASTPEAVELPEDEDAVRTLPRSHPDGRAAPPAAEDADDGATPAAEDPGFDWTPLEVAGVIGGALSFDLPLAPDDALALLLDFENADGRRAWAPRIEPVAPGPDAAPGARFARFHFEGKAGIDPVVVLEFRVRRLADGGALVRYRLAETDFGLAAFFGDYRVAPLPGGAGSRVTERVFIDSGVWIANADLADVEAGLREDARLLTAWAAMRAAR